MRNPRGPRPALMQLTDRQRAMREQMAAGRRRPHDEVQRAAIMVQSADGARTRQLAEACGGSDPTIRRWRTRWVHAIPQLPRPSHSCPSITWRARPRNRPPNGN
ncbi:MAG: helix-turn-helix domain-containing protein [Candidatus Entotheonellia bacterium]